jgi:hypothetical protein
VSCPSFLPLQIPCITCLVFTLFLLHGSTSSWHAGSLLTFFHFIFCRLCSFLWLFLNEESYYFLCCHLLMHYLSSVPFLLISFLSQTSLPFLSQSPLSSPLLSLVPFSAHVLSPYLLISFILPFSVPMQPFINLSFLGKSPLHLYLYSL